MKIQIDISSHALPERQLSALIAAMMTYGSLTPDALADIVAPWDMPRRQAAELKAEIEAFSATRTFDISGHPTLQGNRRIEPDDDPSAGVEKAALNSDARGELAQTLTSLMPNFAGSAPANLAEVFGMAGMPELAAAQRAANEAMAAKGPTDADIAGENQQSTNEQATLIVAPGVQLDNAGLPWDSRIHAGSKAMVADGTWRQRRGVDPAIVATVEAQLRQAMAVPAVGDTHGSSDLDADAAKLEAMGGDAGMTVGDIEVAGGVTGQLARQIVPPPPPRKSTTAAPTSSAQAAETGEIDTFPRLLKFITEQKLAGKLNQPQVAAALTAIGIEGPLPVLQTRPDLIPKMVAKLRAIGGV